MHFEAEKLRLTEANKLLNKALILLNNEHKTLVLDIIESNKQELSSYNDKKTLNIVDVTRVEYGSLVKNALKQIVSSYYHDDFCNNLYEYSEQYRQHDGENCECNDCVREDEIAHKIHDDLQRKLMDACERTVISHDVISAKVIIKRERNKENRAICDELTRHLNMKMLEQFNEQNKEFIKTHLLSR